MRRRYAGVKDIRLIHQIDNHPAVAAPLVAADARVRMLKLGKGDAVRKGFEVTVLEEAVRAVELAPGDGDRALERLEHAGVRIA